MEPESCISVFGELLLAIDDEEVNFDGSERTDVHKEVRHED